MVNLDLWFKIAITALLVAALVIGVIQARKAKKNTQQDVGQPVGGGGKETSGSIQKE